MKKTKRRWQPRHVARRCSAPAVELSLCGITADGVPLHGSGAHAAAFECGSHIGPAGMPVSAPDVERSTGWWLWWACPCA